MPKSLQVAAASGVCAVMVVGWLWLSMEPGAHGPEGAAITSAQSSSGEAQTPDSPFAALTDSSASRNTGESVKHSSKEAGELKSASTPSAALTLIDISQVARTELSDDEFDSIVLQLRADPALLQRLVDEFRQEQDPERRLGLMKLLGYAGGPDVILLASELVYSGDEQLRQLGLQMLQRAQPGSAEVQQIASALLATEIEPRVLVSTLVTLARPGTVVTEDRALLADQVAVMASHPDAGVRGVSLDILSRLSTDGRDTPVLLAGLADESARVREAAAYALVGHENDSDAVRSSLWQLLRNPEEPAASRSAALLALRSLSQTQEQEAELSAVERELNTVQRAQ